MAAIFEQLNGEFVVRRTRLPRVTPFPSWNGVLSSHARNGLISMIAASGDVFLLRERSSHDVLEIKQILASEQKNIMAMCQAWSVSGRWLIVARDRVVTIYQAQHEDQQLIVSAQWPLRFAPTAMDIVEADGDRLHVVVGCVAGVFVFEIHPNQVTTTKADERFLPHTSASLPDVAVAIVRVSPDQSTLAVGTMDGRVFFLPYNGGSAVDASEGSTTVVAAPRVTSLVFAPAGDHALVATRKGNVYVFTRTQTAQWFVDSTYETLVANPKGGAASPTLAAWWRVSPSQSTPVFVLAGRAASSSLEMIDVQSGARLHTLQLGTIGIDQGKGCEPHLLGIVCVRGPTHANPPRLLCIDSAASIFTIEWPFLRVVSSISPPESNE